MTKPTIGNTYESRDARRPKRIRIIELRSHDALCETKHPRERAYTGLTTISRDRLNGKGHWRLVRRGS